MPRPRSPAHLRAYPSAGGTSPGRETTTGETTPMKALAAFWVRFLTLATFVTIAGFVFVRGQSPTIKVVDLIPASLSGETNQDSEPFLAVQAVNPEIMFASAFTPNPFSSNGNAPVYFSADAS